MVKKITSILRIDRVQLVIDINDKDFLYLLNSICLTNTRLFEINSLKKKYQLKVNGFKFFRCNTLFNNDC